MSEQPNRKQPTPQHTDFESMTHAQLVAMLDSANAEGAYDLAAKLSKAASTITKIGDDLMTYVKGLEWQGEAGDTFREWGGQTASATLHLGEYAEVASRWMGIVSQAIAEAKAVMPDTSETTAAQADLRTAEKSLAATKEPGARNDPDSRKLAQTAQSDATAAQGRIDAARYEAVQQMRKLAQAYQQSAAQVNSVEPPTFVPPARSMDPDKWVGGRDQYESITVLSGGSGNGTGSSTASGLNGREREITSHSIPTVPGKGRTSHSDPVTMGLDGLNTLPKSPGPDLIHPPTVPGGSERPDPRLPSQPVGIPPFNGNRSGTGPTAPGRVPSATRAPFLPGQGMANGSARMPRETGIVGGRPVPPASGRPTGSLPRGTVIGEGTQGRTAMGRGITPGMPVGGNSGGGHSNAAPTGRRLASETGGMIGNRPNQPGNGGARPFTPGGTGLTRHAGGAAPAQASTQRRDGATAHAANSPSPRRDPRQSDRPDYLTEDEETWQRANRRPLPPVVD
ncbi:WXG100 family type VII secretion target [Streptomyces sp. NPDC002787]